MKTRIRVLLLSLVTTILTSGCVTQSEFRQFKLENSEKLEAADFAIETLLCESRNDAYEDMLDSDEPRPTRRDEPRGTRRDEACKEDFAKMTGTHLQICKASMQRCTDPADAGLPAPQCRTCYTNCLSSGAWPNADCPLP